MNQALRDLTVILDIDDCVFSFLGPFLDCYNEKFGTTISTSDITDYNFDTDKSSFLKQIEASGFYSNLPLEFGALCFIKNLNKLKIKIIFITARPEVYKRDTLISLYQNNIEYEKLYFFKNKHVLINSLKKTYDIQLL